jgi:hypothetical protein
MPAFIDLTGQRFGRLVAESYIKPPHRRWQCRCDCGNVARVPAGNLRSGMTNSCGCLLKYGIGRRTHGFTRTRVYEIWKSMRKRCRNPNDPSFKHYGARGIKVCERWDKDFLAFLEDMGLPPGDGQKEREYSVERVNNDGDYAPDNCVWVPLPDQATNRRNNRNITHAGRTQCLQAWADESKVTGQHLRGRLRDGWYFEDAISLPVGARRPRKRPRNDPEP